MEALKINWVAVYNRLFRLIDGPRSKETGMYYSGPRFIEKIQEYRDCPSYTELISGREQYGYSTSRRDYFKDLFVLLKDDQKYSFVSEVLRDAQKFDPVVCDEIRVMMGGGTIAPAASIPPEAWSADRLNEYLRSTDEALADKKYGLTVTLAYTCLEGFFKAFVHQNLPFDDEENEIVALARMVKDFLKASNKQYPDEILNLITQSAHAVNKTRDGFSDSHFGEEAERWLAYYMRDLVNTQIRLLLHFM
jgi:hypothetical protein